MLIALIVSKEKNTEACVCGGKRERERGVGGVGLFGGKKHVCRLRRHDRKYLGMDIQVLNGDISGIIMGYYWKILY
jgi:hypothetical protein